MQEFIHSIIADVVEITGVKLFIVITIATILFGFIIAFILLYVKAIRFKTNSEKTTAVVTSGYSETLKYSHRDIGVSVSIGITFLYLSKFGNGQNLKKKYKEAFKQSQLDRQYEYTIKFKDKKNIQHEVVIRDLIDVQEGENINILYDCTNPQKCFRTLQHALLPAIQCLLGVITFLPLLIYVLCFIKL
jgi:hypothetical protein